MGYAHGHIVVAMLSLVGLQETSTYQLESVGEDLRRIHKCMSDSEKPLAARLWYVRSASWPSLCRPLTPSRLQHQIRF